MLFRSGADAVRILSVHKSKGLQFPVVIYPFADFKLRDTNKSVWAPVQLFPEEIRQTIQLPDADKMQLKLSISKTLPDGELKILLDSEIQKQELDSLNIHYVAMTRAKHELHVLFKNDKKKDDSESANISNISQLLNGFVQVNESLFETITNPNGTEVLSYGMPMPQDETSDKKEPAGIALESLISRDRSSIPPRGRTWEKGKARLTGDLFHLLMSEMDFTTDVHQQFSDFCIKYAIENEQGSVLNKMLHSLMGHTLMSELFSSNVQYMNEATIIDKAYIYRPDKIIFAKAATDRRASCRERV